ncbi:hypothetical protein H2248_012151 [Termitomyces sp. 'cryptogamus']|nr:hypothetical protein H2248_012151 [Termitomyces sp. 'cryptogamus']
MYQYLIQSQIDILVRRIGDLESRVDALKHSRETPEKVQLSPLPIRCMGSAELIGRDQKSPCYQERTHQYIYTRSVSLSPVIPGVAPTVNGERILHIQFLKRTFVVFLAIVFVVSRRPVLSLLLLKTQLAY